MPRSPERGRFDVDERLSALLASLHERFDPRAEADEDVRAFLVAEGYEERRIGEILALFHAHSGAEADAVRRAESREAKGVPIQQAVAFRVLGPHERGRFTPEAWGHLLSLSGTGLLTGGELEQVIDRALTHIEGRIAVDDLRALLEAAWESQSRPSSGGVTIH